MTKITIKKPSKSLVIAAFAAIYLIWGSTYLGIALAIETIPAFLMASMRFIIAGTMLLAYVMIKGEKFPPLNQIMKIALGGLLMLFLGNGAVTWVEQYLPTGFVAIIVATVPLWFVLLDKRQWNYYFSNKKIIVGLCIGFAGVVMLFAGKSAGNVFASATKILSVIILLGGTIAWTAGSLYAKYTKLEGSTLMKVGIQTLAAGLAFLISALIGGEHHGFSFAQVSHQSWLSLTYLILMGSLVGYLAYVWLLSVKPASIVGTYAYVNPVVAVLLGWYALNEQVTQQQGIGLGIIILGLVIVNLSKEPKPVEEEIIIRERGHVLVETEQPD